MTLGFMSDADLQDIRSQAEGFMSDTCLVLTKNNTIDAAGNMLEVWTETGPFDCRFAHIERVEGTFGGVAFERESSKVWYVVSLPVDVIVQRGQRLNRGGEIFNVLREFNDETITIASRVLVESQEGDQG